MKTIVPRSSGELAPTSRTGVARVTTLPRRPTHRTRTWVRDLFALPVVATYLNRGERCVILTRRHWVVPLLSIARAGGMMAAVGLLTIVAPSWFLVQLALWLGGLAHAAYVGWCVLRWRAEQIAVTNRRIIRVSGILTRTVDGAPLEQITDTTLRCSIPGRILGYGSIRVETAGQKQAVERLDYVPAPEVIYRARLI